MIVPLSAVLAVYASHLAWARRADLADASPFVDVGFLAVYFGVFSFGSLARERELAPRYVAAFTLANAGLLLGVGTCDVLRLAPHALGAFDAFCTLLLILTTAVAAQQGVVLGRQLGAGAALVAASLAAQRYVGGDALILAWSVLGVIAVLLARGFDAPWLVGVAFLALWGSLVESLAFGARGSLALTGLLLAFVATERLHRAVDPPWLVRGAATAGAAATLLLLLVTLLPASLGTLAWGIAGVATVGYGLGIRESVVRIVGLALLTLTIGRLAIFDLSALAPDQRIVTFLLLGAALLGLSFAYAHFRTRLRKWL